MSSELILSVVVSCYKQEDYIADCLKSIMDQQVSFNFEIIIGDDCSPDKTRAVIVKTLEHYSGKVTLVFNPVNVGAAKNYFSVHNLAQGKYVAHIDGDDKMLPGKLQAQVDVMETNPSCHIVFHRSHYFSDDGSYQADTGSLFEEGKTILVSPHQLARWGTIAAHGSYMYRRSSRKTRDYKFDFMEWFFAFESIAGQGDDVRAAYINQIYLAYRCNPAGNAYLATRAGREKSYSILIHNVAFYFDQFPPYRVDLYAQQLVNILMYIKNSGKLPWSMLTFLLKNALFFRPSALLETIKIRRMVAPEVKIR